MPTHRLVIDQSSAGNRLDVYLARSFSRADQPERKFTRSEFQRLIGQGQVRVNGARAKSSARLRLGDRIEVCALPPRESSLKSEALPVDILYEDEDLVAINKAPGMVVHPAAGRWDGTLVNALLHHCPDIEAIGSERRPGIVHRLDKDTSGVMVIAKTAAALHSLAAQFKNRTVLKEYVGLVWGKLSAGSGVIDRPIGRHRSDRKRMSSLYLLDKSREAVTEWRVEEEFALLSHANSYQWLSLLRLRPRTGRTHQIRVHLADFGYPLVGDRVYGRTRHKGAASALCDSEIDRFPRQALHAERLVIEHPRSKNRTEFYAPLADDLRDLLRALRERSVMGKSRFSPVSARGVDKKRAFK